MPFRQRSIRARLSSRDNPPCMISIRAPPKFCSPVVMALRADGQNPAALRKEPLQNHPGPVPFGHFVRRDHRVRASQDSRWQARISRPSSASFSSKTLVFSKNSSSSLLFGSRRFLVAAESLREQSNSVLLFREVRSKLPRARSAEDRKAPAFSGPAEVPIHFARNRKARRYIMRCGKASLT